MSLCLFGREHISRGGGGGGGGGGSQVLQNFEGEEDGGGGAQKEGVWQFQICKFFFFFWGGGGGARQKGMRSIFRGGADTLEDTLVRLVRDWKEVAKSFIVFNLCRIIHPF